MTNSRMPSPFEIGGAIGNNISGAFRQHRDISAIDQILQDASNDPDAMDNAMRSIISKVSPERQQQAFELLKGKQEQILKKNSDIKRREAFKSQGLDPALADLDPAIQKELIRQKGDENLWRDAINQRNTALNPSQAQPQDMQMPVPVEQGEMGNSTPDQQNPAQNQNTSKHKVKPVYASAGVDPKFFRKDIAKYETARLAEADKGYKRNENYLKTTQEQSESQPFIQDSIRQALADVQSGNVSGALSTLRSKLGQTIPAVMSAEEKNFENSMKNIALEQFASTPGFRSQGEFFILQNVLPKLGDRKKSQELNLKAILDSSLMKSKEEKVVLDVLNQSPNGEVPLNLREIVKERMDDEWKKLYARRYAEDPKVWDKYLNSPAGKNDPLFKDIKNTPVPQSAIDWKNYTKLVNTKGQSVAVHNGQVEKKLSEGYRKIE